mgnify:CR=1 FL=1
MIDEMIDYGFRRDSPQWKRFWPECFLFDDGEDKVENIGIWKRAHDVHVDCVESTTCWERQDRWFSVSGDLALLTRKASATPYLDISAHEGPYDFGAE